MIIFDKKVSWISVNDLRLEERIEIERLIKEGCSCSRIATLIKRSNSCIRMEVRKNGGYYNYDANKSHERHLNALNNRKISNTKRILSDEEKDFLENQVEKGVSLNYLMAKLKTNRRRILSVLKDKNIHYEPKNNFSSIIERVEIIEMQLEIVIETIKVLNDRYKKDK